MPLKDFIKKLTSNIDNSQEQNTITEGGIKVDSVSMLKARALAIEDAKSQLCEQKIISLADCEKSSQNDIKKLLKKNNARLVLFIIPLSSIQSQVYTTAIAQKNIKTFQENLKKVKIEFLTVGFYEYTDVDFPDYWHISKKKLPKIRQL